MLARARSLLPHGPLDVLRQLVLFCGAYWLYRLVRGLVDGRAAEAFDNARDVIQIEKGLGLFVEPSIHAWASAHALVIDFASWMYVNSHFAITTATLAWIYLRRNARFYFVRNMFMVAMGLALVGYMALPTAPPRFLPEWGFSDSVAEFVGEKADQSANVLYNPFAAVPSMHVAFALMIAIPAIFLVKRRTLKVLWGIYPLVVTFVVMVTANHFWLDAALGALVAAASAYAASAAFARARPEAWAWRTAGAKASA